MRAISLRERAFFPSNTERMAFSFLRTLISRIRWLGMMNVLPTYRFFTRPSRYGRLSAAAISIAAGREPSGTGTMVSMSHPLVAICFARRRPRFSWNS